MPDNQNGRPTPERTSGSTVAIAANEQRRFVLEDNAAALRVLDILERVQRDLRSKKDDDTDSESSLAS